MLSPTVSWDCPDLFGRCWHADDRDRPEPSRDRCGDSGDSDDLEAAPCHPRNLDCPLATSQQTWPLTEARSCPTETDDRSELVGRLTVAKPMRSAARRRRLVDIWCRVRAALRRRRHRPGGRAIPRVRSSRWIRSSNERPGSKSTRKSTSLVCPSWCRGQPEGCQGVCV